MKPLPALSFILLFAVSAVQAFDPLERVEEDQTGTTRSSDDIFNRNLALNRLANYTDVSSYKPGRFGWYAHDGDPLSTWQMHPEETEAVLELSWGRAVPVDRITISAVGKIETMKLEIFDGEAWQTVTSESSEKRGSYRFSLRPAAALRLTLQSPEGTGGVSEIEVYNTRVSQPLPWYGSKELVSAMREAAAVILFDGSPYLYSRNGRKLIWPRYAETSLKDRFRMPVLKSVVNELGGTADLKEDGRMEVSLNDETFLLEGEKDSSVIPMLASFADSANIEFLQRGPLVMIGRGLEALDQEDLLNELKDKLGRNPYGVSDRTEGIPDAVVTPTKETRGITYEWAGFRSTAIPDTGIDAWLKYAETKSVRTWRHAPRYMNMYIRPKETIETVEDFKRYRELVRNPTRGDRFKEAHPDDVVALRAFLNKYGDEITEEFRIYNELGIDLINATGPKDWPDDVHNDFINWAGTYMLTYYLAKNFGVAAHQYGNEPDWYFNQISEELVQHRLTLIADAVHSAIEDVNRDHGLNLIPVFSAPVLAGNYTGRSARIMMRNLYTDYDGSKTEEKQFNLFNRHRYSGRPHQNALEVRAAKEMMIEEAGETIPQVFTELNFSTARYWRRPETEFTNDTPAVYTSMAGIWGEMMAEQGVYGIFVFKLNDPGTWFWKDTDRFSNTITYSMHREMDPGTEKPEREQVVYGTKNFEVCRLFSKGFHGSRPLLETEVQCTDAQYRAWTSSDPERQRFYIWSVQANEFEDYLVEMDLSRLDLPADALVTAEAVSGARHGEVSHVFQLSADGKLRFRQAAQSAVLLTVHARPLTALVLKPVADATVMQGKSAQDNFGGGEGLQVGRHSDPNQNRISYVKFALPQGQAPVERSVLELQGQSVGTHAYDGGFLFRVYAVAEDDWSEQDITALNAPNLYQTVSSLREVDLDNYPLGHVTAFQSPGSLRVDATLAVRQAQEEGRDSLTFVLIREIFHPGENTDDLSARISSREAGPDESPRLHLWK